MNPSRMVVDVSDGQMARVAQWDGMIGKNVVIQFDIDAREWHGRWFNSLRAWAIKTSQPEEGGGRVSVPAQQQAEAVHGEVDWDKMGAKDGGAGSAAPSAVANGIGNDGAGQVAEGRNIYGAGDTVGKKENDLPF